MVDLSFDTNDRWIIPDDRQLALRGRLETGWSSYQPDTFTALKKHSLTEDEQEVLRMVLEKKDKIQIQEQIRIGGLVKKLDNMRTKVLGDGLTNCLICGAKAGMWKNQLRFCTKCNKMVCPKCSIEAKFSIDMYTKAYFCVLCYEERQLWKRSGAWFFNSMPKYIIPENNENRLGTLNRNVGSFYNGNPEDRLSKVYMTRNGSHDSIDEGSDSDADETHSMKAFEIPEDRRSFNSGLVMDDEESALVGAIGRRNAVSTEGQSTPGPKKSAAKSHSNELSAAEDDSSDGSNPPSRNDRRFNSQISVSSADDRRGSLSSLSSIDGPRGDKKHKLNIRRVLRKPSRDSKEDTDRERTSSANFEKSPVGPRKSIAGSHHSNDRDTTSNGGSEQDIDAMFKSYESAQGKTAPEQKEFTGKCGMIEFTLQYDPNTQELLAIVHQCKGLKGDKGKMPTLPYVKTFILPEAQKATKKRTSSLKKTPDPIFNETLVYHGVSETDIQNKGLKLCVMDEQKVGNNAAIGETSIPLKNLTNRPVQQFRRLLELKSNDDALFLDTPKTVSNPGRIELALHYLSKQGKLVVGIIRCSNLKALDPNGYSDPYVKCYLLPDPQKKTKQKTQIKKKTLNPEFNEEFTYKIPHAELAKRMLNISVWDYDIGRTNDYIGGITLGIESSGDLLRHWFETLQTQDRRVNQGKYVSFCSSEDFLQAMGKTLVRRNGHLNIFVSYFQEMVLVT